MCIKSYVKNNLFEGMKVSLSQTTWEVVVWMSVEGQGLMISTVRVFLFTFSLQAVPFLSDSFPAPLSASVYILLASDTWEEIWKGRDSELKAWVSPHSFSARFPLPSESWVLKGSMAKPKWALHTCRLLSNRSSKFGNLYPHRIYYPGKLDFQIWQQWKE